MLVEAWQHCLRLVHGKLRAGREQERGLREVEEGAAVQRGKENMLSGAEALVVEKAIKYI